MQPSARNQFVGKVSQIKTGMVNDEIELVVAGGQKIVATVTCDSTEQLGLVVGGEAFALVKASSIIIVTDQQGARFSARNHLHGTVSRLHTEVVLDLPGGGAVAAIITNESSQALGLAVGVPASALFKATSVILGVAA